MDRKVPPCVIKQDCFKAHQYVYTGHLCRIQRTCNIYIYGSLNFKKRKCMSPLSSKSMRPLSS